MPTQLALIEAELAAICQRHDEDHDHPGEEMCDVRVLLTMIGEVQRVARASRDQERTQHARASEARTIGDSHDLEESAKLYAQVATYIEDALARGIPDNASMR